MEQQRRRVIIKPEPPAPIKRVPVIQPPQPLQRRVVADVVPKPRKPRQKRPLVITITILHEQDESGNDVLFKREGTAPSDIDVDAFEQYCADFFGEDVNDEDDEFYDDDGVYVGQ